MSSPVNMSMNMTANIAESVVASAIRSIGSLLVKEAISLNGVEDQVRGLQEELEFMQGYLHDADARQHDQQVCALISQVRKLAYDAEDVIDTYILKVQLRNRNWLMRYANLVYKFPHIWEVREQIQVLQTSLKRVSDKLNSFGIRRIANLERGLLPREDGFRKQRPQTYPYDDNVGDSVVGMEKDIQKLVDIVMGEGRTPVRVISIVGMGGSGKTTLARKLYNHSYAKECFDCCAWVCISQEWSTQHVLSEILRKVVGLEQTTTLLSVEELVEKIRSILEKKSYLVVLDDVWSRQALEEILPALPIAGNVSKGSKIIVTTRNYEIVKYRVNQQDHMYIHEPQPLSEESSWELFSKIALSHRKNYDEESFKNLGKDMLRKCDGLPLAVIALAGILNTRETIGEWQQVGEAVRSRILEGRCGNIYGRVGELLELSYDDLSYDLKPCFLYLSVFPEDCQISVGMLTRMWIAEGLVSTQFTDVSLEDIALQRVEDLSHRFMIQVVRTNYKGAIKSIRLHDLLRDVSVQKAKEMSFLQIYTPFSNLDCNHASTLAIQPRRAAVHSSTSLPTHISHLRSLILPTRSSIQNTLDLQIVSQYFKLLRVLSISGIKTASGILPTQIGRLLHLRYLAVRGTNITELPNSIGGLRNLRTLDYRYIDLENKVEKDKVEIKIPSKVFQGLVLLRNLFLPIEFPWSVQQLELSGMRDLQTLWGVRMDNSEQFLLKEMTKLSTSLKKLKIVVSSENELKAAFCCPSLMNDVLHTLHCDMRGGLALCNIEPLHPRKHLLKLTFIGRIEMKLALILPINLIELRLKDSMIEHADIMEALGALAHLKQLSLSNAYIGTTLSCRPGSFPHLEELSIERFPCLDTWNIHKGAMPCLKKLEFIGCWCLRSFPEGLNSVLTLEQLDFFDMPNSFNKQATECGWSPQKLRLPHNFASIIKHSDSHVDSSSIRKIYEQLIHGIFLDNKTKKYWVTKNHGCYTNSFMVYALGLFIYSKQISEIATHQRGIEKNYHIECGDVIESSEDGAKVTAAKIKRVGYTYYDYCVVAGKFDIGDLSNDVTYEIYWVVMLVDSEHSFDKGLYSNQGLEPEKKDEEKIAKKVERIIIYTLLNERRMHIERMDGKLLNEWMHISGGVLDSETRATMEGEVNIMLSYDEGRSDLDLVIKGFIIQPKYYP